MTSLAGKAALVTGSTSGIGLGIAEHFAALGARVVIHGLEADAARRIAARLIHQGCDAVAIPGDLADVAMCRAVARQTVEQFGGIDVLVNNAASTARGYLEDAPVELWDAIMHVNLRAPFLLLQEAVRSMKTRSGGAIVNIGSGEAHIGGTKHRRDSGSQSGGVILTPPPPAPRTRHKK